MATAIFKVSGIPRFLTDSERGAFAGVARPFPQIIRNGQTLDDYPVIRSYDSNTYLGDLARRVGLVDDLPPECIPPLVKKIRQIASRMLSNHFHRSIGHLGRINHPRINSLTYEEINTSCEFIRDWNLVVSFAQLIRHVDERDRPQSAGSLTKNAQIIRTWMAAHTDYLDALVGLDLSDRNLTQLPSEIMSLNRLRVLQLGGNVVAEFANFNFPHLVELDITNMNLTELPPVVMELNELQILYLGDNPITLLPIDFSPPNLECLDLSYSDITILPEGFNPPNLRVLRLGHTSITALPEDFNPPNLQILELGHTNITALPEGFNPPKLRILELYNTNITALPEGFRPANFLRVLGFRSRA